MADYNGEVIRISELAGENGEIRDSNFRNCEIKGPALLAPFDSEIINPKWEGNLDAIIWEIPPERGRVIGAIGVFNCRFRMCTFRNVGLAVTPEMAAKVRAAASPH
jgi:hypothetical protein